MCPSAIAPKEFEPRGVDEHMRVHRERGHLQLLQEYPDPLIVQWLGENDLAQEDELDEDSVAEDGVVDNEIEGEIEDEVDVLISAEFSSDGIFCDEHRKRIREANESVKSLSLQLPIKDLC